MQPDLSGLSVIEEYRQRALNPDISAMSGREGRSSATTFIAQRILDAVNPVPDQLMIDVGCGDGTLIELASLHGVRCIGILPTEEEVARLISERRFDIRLGTVHNTGLPPDTADLVVCSGVLHIAPPLSEAVAELARITRPGGILYLGEVARTIHARHIPRWRIIASNLKHRGIFAALTVAMRSMKETKRYEAIQPDRLIGIASKHGLSLLRRIEHLHLKPDGTQVHNDERPHYVFQKRGVSG